MRVGCRITPRAGWFDLPPLLDHPGRNRASLMGEGGEADKKKARLQNYLKTFIILKLKCVHLIKKQKRFAGAII